MHTLINAINTTTLHERQWSDRNYEHHTNMTIKQVFGFTIDKSKSANANAERILDDEPNNVNKIQQQNFTFL